jgi:hypothetical protein
VRLSPVQKEKNPRAVSALLARQLHTPLMSRTMTLTKKRSADEADLNTTTLSTEEEVVATHKTKKTKKIEPSPTLTCSIVSSVSESDAKTIEWRYGRLSTCVQEMEDMVTGFFLLTDRFNSARHRVIVQRAKAIDESGKPAGKVFHVLGDVYGKVEELPIETEVELLTGSSNVARSPLLIPSAKNKGCYNIPIVEVNDSESVKVVVPKWRRQEPTLLGFLTKPVAFFWSRDRRDETLYSLFVEIPRDQRTVREKIFVQILYGASLTEEEARARRLANPGSSGGEDIGSTYTPVL